MPEMPFGMHPCAPRFLSWFSFSNQSLDRLQLAIQGVAGLSIPISALLPIVLYPWFGQKTCRAWLYNWH
jgi:hypothetical protein